MAAIPITEQLVEIERTLAERTEAWGGLSSAEHLRRLELSRALVAAIRWTTKNERVVKAVARMIKDPAIAAVLETFPDAEITGVSKTNTDTSGASRAVRRL